MRVRRRLIKLSKWADTPVEDRRPDSRSAVSKGPGASHLTVQELTKLQVQASARSPYAATPTLQARQQFLLQQRAMANQRGTPGAGMPAVPQFPGNNMMTPSQLPTLPPIPGSRPSPMPANNMAEMQRQLIMQANKQLFTGASK